MNKKAISMGLAVLTSFPIILFAQRGNEAAVEHRRQSNERSLYDENRARVDRKIWQDEQKYRPDYWTDSDYLYIPQNERSRYEPRPVENERVTGGNPLYTPY